MKIRVFRTVKAAKDPSGVELFEYKSGETYEIFDWLAKVFISQGWGYEEKEEIKEIEAIEVKAVEDLEDKAIDNLENKSIKKKGKK